MKVKNKKREVKAQDYANKYGISVATVKRYFSQDREDYEEEARKRRLQAYCFRNMGLKWAEVGERLGTSKHGAIALYKRYEKIDATENKKEA